MSVKPHQNQMSDHNYPFPPPPPPPPPPDPPLPPGTDCVTTIPLVTVVTCPFGAVVVKVVVYVDKTVVGTKTVVGI